LTAFSENDERSKKRVARIPEAEVERLKREVSLERLVEAKGVRLQRRGADLHGCCPWHDDKTPSLVVTPSKNLWHCFGACAVGGSVIDWVMRSEGISFRHAVELLKADYLALGEVAPVKRSTVQKLETPLDTEADDRELMRQVAAYYHETAKGSPELLGYLERRELHSSEMLERFQLGFANRTLAYRLPQKNRAEGAHLRGRLQRLGILRESGHEHFNGSLVIPVFDEQGAVREMYGRKITDYLRAGTPLHLYLPGEHKGVWNVEALAASREIILCEALIDALTFWVAGYRNVTASYGVEGFTADHLAAFKRHGTERVLIAYDRDDAGEKAASALAEKLQAEGIGCFRIPFPRGQDANEYARSVSSPEKSLGTLIRNAVWLGNGAAPITTSEPRSESSPHDTAAREEQITAQDVPPSLAAVVAETEPLASPIPTAPPSAETPIERNGEEIIMPCGDRRYRVRGLAKNLSFDSLRVNVLASRGEAFHVDTLELYTARQRALFIKQAAEEMQVKEDVVKRDLGRLLLKLEELQEQQIKRALEPKQKTVEVGEDDGRAALSLLKDPELLGRILSDYERCGIIGEETNKLVCYLGAVSRKLDEPLAIIIQSSSAAGKSALMNAALQMMPEEEQVKYSAMTGQSLFYMEETNLKGKILAIVEEEGAERASYALKLLQSEGELTIASTGKDPTTGRLVTHEYRVEGPVMLLLTTTAVEVDEELLNRCIVLTVDEDREQTRAIHRLQRERQTLEGLLAKQDRNHILAVHRNAQRLLKPLMVANPFARHLTFFDNQTRARRDHVKYLTLIRTIALLHQHQRPTKTTVHHGQTLHYIEATVDDIAAANILAHEALGRSLDELAPQTRRLLMLIDEMVTAEGERLAVKRADHRFSRRDVREWTGWGNTQLRLHLARLEDLEYLLTHRGGRGQQFVYELLYDGAGKDGETFMCGLLDVDSLRQQYDANLAGVETNLAGSKRGANGAVSGGVRSDETPMDKGADDEISIGDAQTALIGETELNPSYRSYSAGGDA
jgi:DNA primase catalytic core